MPSMTSNLFFQVIKLKFLTFVPMLSINIDAASKYLKYLFFFSLLTLIKIFGKYLYKLNILI